MKKILAAAAAVALSIGIAGAANASTFTITGGTTIDTSSVTNDNFYQGLINAGYTKFNYGGTLGLSSSSDVVVDKKASEAFYTDSFLIGGSVVATNSPGVNIYNGGDQSATANNLYIKPGVFVTTLHNITSGDIQVGGADAFGFQSGGAAVAPVNGDGTVGWGIFYNPNDLSSLVVGFDDGGAGPDGNHDDLQMKLTIVPEPATWGLMILGFAGLGFAARRRSFAARA